MRQALPEPSSQRSSTSRLPMPRTPACSMPSCGGRPRAGSQCLHRATPCFQRETTTSEINRRAAEAELFMNVRCDPECVTWAGGPPIGMRINHGGTEITEKTLWKSKLRVCCVGACPERSRRGVTDFRRSGAPHGSTADLSRQPRQIILTAALHCHFDAFG